MHRPPNIATSILLATAAAASAPMPFQPVRPDQSDSVVDAAFAQGRVWMRLDDGRVSSLAPGEHALRRENLAEPAAGLCVHKGDVVVVTGARNGAGPWHLRRLSEGWATPSEVALTNEELVALACAEDGVMLVTRRHVVEFDGGKPRLRRLKPELAQQQGVVMAVHATPQALFIGTNAGEWGGSLIRIDRRAGTLARVAGMAAPVNAIVDDPAQPGCIAVAEGLIHLDSSGRLMQVCAGEARTLYSAKVDVKALANGYVPDVAFFGLAVDGRGLLAVAPRELHRLDAQRHATVEKMPALHDIDGVGISFDVPGYVLLTSSVNQRHSISGSTPMLVPMNAAGR